MPVEGAPPSNLQERVDEMPQSGGLLPPNFSNTVESNIPIKGEGLVRGPQVPSGGAVITVRTDAEAMAADGLMMGAGMGRQVRRNPYRNFGGIGGMCGMGGMGGIGQMGPAQPRYTPMEGGGSGGTITITKLE